jgi:hypothetical protein
MRAAIKSRVRDMVNNGRVEADGTAPRLGRREGRSPRDMALSLAVLIVPIVLLLAFYRGVLGGDTPVSVDPGPAIAEARSARAFPVLVARGLSDDWHVSSATFRRATEGATLRIGYVAPDDDSVLVVQSSVPPATLLPAELGKDSKPIGTLRTGTGVWRQYRARPGEQAFVLADAARTVVVVGTADTEHLEDLTGRLGQP